MNELLSSLCVQQQILFEGNLKKIIQMFTLKHLDSKHRIVSQQENPLFDTFLNVYCANKANQLKNYHLKRSKPVECPIGKMKQMKLVSVCAQSRCFDISLAQTIIFK